MKPHGELMDLTNIDNLPPAPQARWPIAVKRAEDKVQRLESNACAAARLVLAAQRARSVTQRVVWLQRAATAWAQPFAGIAACRRGCSHCCHIPVAISHTEAALIGAAIGRTPQLPMHPVVRSQTQTPAQFQEAESRLGAANPSGEARPFLVDSACSIYAHRPMVCRTLLNLDDDDLLCRLVPGVDVPVPYADATRLKALYLAAQPNAELADIRAFFPRARMRDAA